MTRVSGPPLLLLPSSTRLWLPQPRLLSTVARPPALRKPSALPRPHSAMPSAMRSVSLYSASVIGVVPYAMVAAGGEQEKAAGVSVQLNEAGREAIEHIVVDSMHERKVEMAKRSCGFVGLPGGFGTFEEVLEVTTWTQLGIHNKPVVLLNVLGFWEPLRHLINSSIDFGFIRPISKNLVVFVDGPASHTEHESYDWGKAALEALNAWKRDADDSLFKWTETKAHKTVDALEST
ncbi:hypothetical protein MKEN_01207900 [Mycena kentingensis (nom. inval.)]|nr:hypothetical protein MKEN_01207900 [Mycena kentingensis (nom. inval.)]